MYHQGFCPRCTKSFSYIDKRYNTQCPKCGLGFKYKDNCYGLRILVWNKFR